MHGAAAPVPQAGTGELDAKLGLVEFLLGNTELQVSARRAVDWLVSQTGIRQAIVALAEPAGTQLLLVAEHGISSSAIVDFVLTREEESHPLIKAMRRSEPTYFDGSTSFRSPIDGRFHAIPLRSEDDHVVHGLLLTSTSGPELHGEVPWLAQWLSDSNIPVRRWLLDKVRAAARALIKPAA